MRPFVRLVARFGRDESGVFAIMFGLMAVVLIAMGGAVVDYVRLEQTRNRAQIALDAAALALQSQIFEGATDTAIKAQARALVIERVGDSAVFADVDVARIDLEKGSLYLEAEVKTPTLFVGLVGVNQLGARIVSEATRKRLELEIALVLDNSGSMSYTGAGTNGTRQRMQFLKDAANCAVNILFYKDVVDNPSNLDTCIAATGAKEQEDVRIGVVPFTMYVNVGASNRTSGWVDQTNASVIANDNFDNDDDEDSPPPPPPATQLPNRFQLFAATGEAWRGCVEARPHIKSGSKSTEYLDTDDTSPTSGNTLFVPLFSPDLPDGIGGNNYVSDSPAVCDRPNSGVCTIVQRRTGCNDKMNNGSCVTTTISATPSGPVNFSSDEKFAFGYYGAHPQSCGCRASNPVWKQTAGSNNNRTFETTYTCTGGGYIPMGLSSRELQERVCKYFGPLNSSSFSSGPNADCTRTPVLPLNDNPTTVSSTITSMTAEGGTNIHEGTAWGFRVLSPGAPFSEGGPYNSSTAKVMILMTDGENTAYNLSTHCTTPRTLNGSCYNSAYGFPYNSRNTKSASTSGGDIERLGPLPSVNGSVASTNAILVQEMNKRTSQTCENAKAAGITVYVIGLATSKAEQSTQAVVEEMLASCASSRDKAYFPQTPGELKTVFTDIADDLSALRLAQ
jgi:Flp pilus assembly protein TadG